MNKQMSSALAQGDQTPVVLVGSKEVDLVDNRELRNSLVENEAVFDDSRVKALVGFLLPKDFGATTEQVANYFEIPIGTLKSTISEHSQELSANGYKTYEKEELKALKGELENPTTLKFTSSLGVFSRRAILNVAMLLRDSQVAKTIRSVLLDATENKTVVKEIVNQQQFDMSQLSPSLQAFGQLFQSMAQMEINQSKIQSQLNQVNHHALEAKATAEQATKQMEAVKDAMLLDHDSWRKECNNIINKIAKEQRGGTKEAYKEVRDEVYALLEQRAGAKLKIRVRNKQDNLRREGAPKSKIDKVSQIDVIAEDKRLKEIYIAVVKDMTIKYGVV